MGRMTTTGRVRLSWIAVGSTVSWSVLSASAAAAITGTATDLQPLTPRPIAHLRPPQSPKITPPQVSIVMQPEVTYRPQVLRSVAHRVNQSVGTAPESPNRANGIDLSFLEPFVDENGAVNLPLGLTVYEAMGTPSIGFGGDF